MVSEMMIDLVVASTTWKHQWCSSAGPMVKPLRPRKSQDLRVPGLVWMMIGLPRGAKGVVSKLKGTLKCSQAEMERAMWDCLRRFRVSLVCRRIFPHRKLGNVLDTPTRIVRKWTSKVLIMCSYALRRCMLGGTSWKVAFHFSSIWGFNAVLHLLSSICRSTFWPFFWSWDMMRFATVRWW